MRFFRDLFSDNTSEMRNMWETIEKLRNRVEDLEAEKRYLHRHIDGRMDHIENNFADQIAEKCYVRSIDEGSLLYLLNKIRKHKKEGKK